MKSVKFLVTTTLVGTFLIGMLALAYMEFKPSPSSANEYKVVKKWIMPNALEEISGISWMEDDLMASIQDEDGIIYIYDLKSSQLVNQISFSGEGDYEGIVVVGTDAYVMRSDGKIFEVSSFRESKKSKTTTFNTGFTSKNNMESLTISMDQQQLITIPKDRDEDKKSKYIYKIDLESKGHHASKYLKVDMEDQAFEDFHKKKDRRTLNPADIAINPLNQDIYIIEGRRPKIVVMDKQGAIKKVITLGSKDFPQPEGITFSKDGRLFVASEGQGGHGTISQISISM